MTRRRADALASLIFTDRMKIANRFIEIIARRGKRYFSSGTDIAEFHRRYSPTLQLYLSCRFEVSPAEIDGPSRLTCETEITSALHDFIWSRRDSLPIELLSDPDVGMSAYGDELDDVIKMCTLLDKEMVKFARIKFWSCEDSDTETLTHGDRDEAISEYIEEMIHHNNTTCDEKVFVTGYAQIDAVDEIIKEDIITPLLEKLDEEYAPPYFYEWSKPTKAMIEAQKQFLATVAKEYDSWACEEVKSSHEYIHVRDWIESCDDADMLEEFDKLTGGRHDDETDQSSD